MAQGSFKTGVLRNIVRCEKENMSEGRERAQRGAMSEINGDTKAKGGGNHISDAIACLPHISEEFLLAHLESRGKEARKSTGCSILRHSIRPWKKEIDNNHKKSDSQEIQNDNKVQKR